MNIISAIRQVYRINGGTKTMTNEKSTERNIPTLKDLAVNMGLKETATFADILEHIGVTQLRPETLADLEEAEQKMHKSLKICEETMGSQGLKKKATLNYRKASKADGNCRCQSCAHYRHDCLITGIGGVFLGYQDRCALFCLDASRRYRIRPIMSVTGIKTNFM
jgi:hypothetical protein